MKKSRNIIYWIATIWLSLGMLSSGIVQLLQLKEETEFIINLGYPNYVLPILGVWKILGVIAILIPRYPLLKEWAYAGFFFMMSSAFASHIINGNAFSDTAPSLLLLVLTIISWLIRPAERKLPSAAF
ncbi:MAG TPA: DoxX family protein [Flavihumibacter sp.]